MPAVSLKKLTAKKRKRVRAKGKTKSTGLPAYPDLREPQGLSPFVAFLESLEGEIPLAEARIEFQNEWCDHPKSAFRLLSTTATIVEQNFNYTRVCSNCGLVKTLKGRPPAWLQRQ